MKRWFQFSLRTLFIITTLAAVLAWSVPQAVERYRENQWRITAENEAQKQALYQAKKLRTSDLLDALTRQIQYDRGKRFNTLPPPESP